MPYANGCFEASKRCGEQGASISSCSFPDWSGRVSYECTAASWGSSIEDIAGKIACEAQGGRWIKDLFGPKSTCHHGPSVLPDPGTPGGEPVSGRTGVETSFLVPQGAPGAPGVPPATQLPSASKTPTWVMPVIIGAGAVAVFAIIMQSRS
jgi:hypothetical protein